MWIRHLAALHFIGDAFDPEHMRSLANIASDTVNGKEFPDYYQTTVKARERAFEEAAHWHEILNIEESDDGSEAMDSGSTGESGQPGT
jgi:hypothetical protein